MRVHHGFSIKGWLLRGEKVMISSFLGGGGREIVNLSNVLTYCLKKIKVDLI